MKNITWIFVLTFSWFSNTYCKKDFFVTRKNNEYKCITNSSYAMSWITNDNNKIFNQVSVFVPERANSDNFFDCKIKSNDPATHQYFLKESWVLKESTNDIVLDRRWEDMKVYVTEGTTYYRSRLQFVPLVNITKNNFEIPLSIRTYKEAHIFLCDGEKPPNSNCYWFLLQAGSANATTLRKCPKGSIPSLNIYSKSLCQELKAYKMDERGFELYLTSELWSHYLLRKNKNRLSFTQVKKNENLTILEFADTNNVINVTHLLVNSKGNNKAFWKIHKFEYLYTNKEVNKVRLGSVIKVESGWVCISMFVKMCETCELTLHLSSNKHNVIADSNYKIRRSDWHEIRFVNKNIQNDYVYLLVSTSAKKTGDNFWAIDNVRLCQEQEFRVLNVKSENEDITCQLMSNGIVGKSFLQYNPKTSDNEFDDLLRENKCSENTIGKFCVKCKWLYKNCSDIQISESDKISNVSNYRKSENETWNGKVCKSGTYGFNCEKICGNCSSGVCDIKNGDCYPPGCKSNYEGRRCDLDPEKAAALKRLIIVLKKIAEIKAKNMTHTNTSKLTTTEKPTFTEETSAYNMTNVPETAIIVKPEVTNITCTSTSMTIQNFMVPNYYVFSLLLLFQFNN